MSLKVVYVTCGLLLMAGCSNIGNKVIYRFSQPVSEQSCFRKHPIEQEQCLADAKKRIPYEQYSKERKEIIRPSTVPKKIQ